MQKWEYKVLPYSVDAHKVNLLTMDDETLNHLGDHGWELVSCISTTKTRNNAEIVLMFFKRSIKAVSSRRTDQSEKPEL
jgi:hypothetical protein